jgi:predicted nucleic acid-binding Zn ribbon protein
MLDDPPDLDDSDMDQNDDDEDFADTGPCPSCGKPVYEDADVCPNCGHYITQDEFASRKPLWIILTAGICVAVILIVWVLLRL